MKKYHKVLDLTRMYLREELNRKIKRQVVDSLFDKNPYLYMDLDEKMPPKMDIMSFVIQQGMKYTHES